MLGGAGAGEKVQVSRAGAVLSEPQPSFITNAASSSPFAWALVSDLVSAMLLPTLWVDPSPCLLPSSKPKHEPRPRPVPFPLQLSPFLQLCSKVDPVYETQHFTKKKFLDPLPDYKYKVVRLFPDILGGVSTVWRSQNFSFLSKSTSYSTLFSKTKRVIASNYAWNDPATKGVEP